MLPKLDAKAERNGWRLAAKEKMMWPKEFRDMAEEAKGIFEEIAKDHPETPWAVLADKHKEVKLGLEWQPARLK